MMHRAWFILMLLALAAGMAHAASYIEKNEFADTPFSDWASPVKERLLGEGFAASLGGSLQQRYGKQDNRRDFSDDLNDEDFSILSRERLNLDIHNGHLFKGFLEVQDAHEFFADRNRPGSNPNEDSLDIYQAYGEFGLFDDIADKPSLVIRAGRQTMVLGHEHYFGDNDWLNRGTQPLDQVRAIWFPEGFRVDAFAGWPVTFDDHNPDSPMTHTNLVGANLKALGIPHGHNVEGLVFYKFNDKTNFKSERGNGIAGPEHELAMDFCADGKFATRWDYSLEASYELGSRGEDNIMAWRGIGEIGYTKSFLWRTLRMSLNYSQTSGDKDPDDGITQSFDPLFTRQFNYHGKILLPGARNLVDFFPKVEAKVWRGGLIEIDYHLLKLQQAKDGFFASNGTLLRRNPAGQGGKSIGQEIDFQVTHNFHDNFSVSAGYFIFDPNRVFRSSGNKGDDNATQGFVMINVGF